MLLHVLSACIREVLSIRRRSSNASRIFHHTHRQPHRRGSIAPDGLDGSWRHLLEADNERAVDRSGSDEGAGECKSRRSRRASVVCIVYRYSAALYVIFSSCDLNVYSVHRLLFSKLMWRTPGMYLRSHAKLIEDPLSTRRIPVAITRNTRLHIIVIDLCI
jgi:hypothetical protein